MSADDIRARIEAARNPKPVAIDVPGVGEVFARVATAKQAAETRALSEEFDAEDQRNGTKAARVAAQMLCDEAGALLYDPRNAEHIAALMDLGDQVVGTILTKCRDANYPPIEKDASGKA